MKKIVESFSLIFLTLFSFFYTDKVINMINQKDPLMTEIASAKEDYAVLPVNAILKDDTIIPGIKGKEVDIDKSYEKMKSGGIFREEALIFSDIYPTNTLQANKDKYIIRGNTTKQEVSIIYILNKSNINKIKNINNITLFINHKDLTISTIKELKEKEIYTYGTNGEYNEECITNDNTLINNLSNNKSNYCLTREKNQEIISICSKKNMHTVLPNIIGGHYEIKNNISNGSIILLNNLNEIDVIIKYIESKGYKIVPLSQLLEE